ncbi:MAG TPA: histidine kinase [Saprospiraceae bacterium]|nr:histidine kinase [Saprospiraceae bacterium]
MNKVFWYCLIFAAIATYFYVGYSVSSHWEAAVKYGNKVTHDSLGKQIPLLNIKDTREGDFYVIIDSLKNRRYFRVLGLTVDSLLCINYGNDASVLPQILDYSSYITSPGLFIDKRVSWVDELMKNDENFNDKIDFLTIDHIDSLLSTHVVIGFELTNKRPLTWFEIVTSYFIGSPIILGIMILGLMFLIFIFESLINVYIHNRRKIYRFSIVLVIILLYALAHRQLFVLSDIHRDQWFGTLFIFVSHALVFGVFQYGIQKIRSKEFGKREFIKFILIVFLGVGFDVLFRLVLSMILDESSLGEDMLELLFFTTLQQAFKFWTAIATANFLHNLIRYIYSLRRKSKQLQSATSDAQTSAALLQQSEANINTHFLYNSLHAIAALAPVAPDKTETLALSLAKYYRYTTNRNDETWVSVKDEVEALTAYLEVEKIRMGEKLNYTFDIKDDVLSSVIPKFILQPLVENAIKYGYNSERNTTDVKISFEKIDVETIKISICDSGKPFNEAMEICKNIMNVKDILKRYYPDRHMIGFVNEPVKCVEILMNGKKSKS